MNKLDLSQTLPSSHLEQCTSNLVSSEDLTVFTGMAATMRSRDSPTPNQFFSFSGNKVKPFDAPMSSFGTGFNNSEQHNFYLLSLLPIMSLGADDDDSSIGTIDSISSMQKLVG
jgi:hypothetical protein